MPIEARREYLNAIIERYEKANRKQKSVILTEFCEVCGYNRKYAILILSNLATGWTENRSLWGKTGSAVVMALKEIEIDLPFFMKGFSSDNGSEFLNQEMESYLIKSERKVHWTRRRPYKKNDAAHVEQKNWTHVRELFGYDRFDNIHLKSQMDLIYKKYWNQLQNFFIPVFKLHSKERVGRKVKKVYDKPQTPYQRLINGGYLAKDQVTSLKRRMSELNPVELKKELDKKLKEFWITAEKHRVRRGYL